MKDRLNFNQLKYLEILQNLKYNFSNENRILEHNNSKHYYIFMTNHEYDMVWQDSLAQTANYKCSSNGVMNMGILAKLYRQARLSIMEVSSLIV